MMSDEEVIEYTQSMLKTEQRKVWRIEKRLSREEFTYMGTSLKIYKRNVSYLKAVLKKFTEEKK